MEHRQVIAQIRLDKPQLNFPKLYAEMFKLNEAEEEGHLEREAQNAVGGVSKLTVSALQFKLTHCF